MRQNGLVVVRFLELQWLLVVAAVYHENTFLKLLDYKHCDELLDELSLNVYCQVISKPLSEVVDPVFRKKFI